MGFPLVKKMHKTFLMLTTVRNLRAEPELYYQLAGAEAQHNAFNLVHRQKILENVQKELPKYARMVWQSYRDSSHLLYGKHVISSQRGVQQGDPLGPYRFCVTINPLVRGLIFRQNLVR